jgi:hypothetical protein
MGASQLFISHCTHELSLLSPLYDCPEYHLKFQGTTTSTSAIKLALLSKHLQTTSNSPSSCDYHTPNSERIDYRATVDHSDIPRGLRSNNNTNFTFAQPNDSTRLQG